MTISEQSGVPLGRSLLAGLGAGGVAAIVASIVSLQLKSPDRVFINSGSVAIAVLLAGLVTGLVYSTSGDRNRGVRNVAIWLVGAFLLVVVAALIVQMMAAGLVLHVVSFCIPLAAISLVIAGVLTPILARPGLHPAVSGPVAGALGLIVGVALAGHGANGRLALPSASGATGAGAEVTSRRTLPANSSSSIRASRRPATRSTSN